MATFKVLKSDNDLFSNAVKNALQRMRFLPAEVGGRKVKQLVQQPFQRRAEVGRLLPGGHHGPMAGAA